MLAVFTKATVEFWVIAVIVGSSSSLEVPETSVTSIPLGSLAVTKAEFVILPVSISACVIVNVPVITELEAPSANDVIGFPEITKPTIGSVITIFVKVVLPVLVTVKV